MNELIALLALRASNSETGWLDRQKFAELIVRECLDILDDEDDGELAGRSVRIAAIRIKKHFGVEE